MGHNYNIRYSVKEFFLSCSMELELEVEESYWYYLTNTIIAQHMASSILSNL